MFNKRTNNVSTGDKSLSAISVTTPSVSHLETKKISLQSPNHYLPVLPLRLSTKTASANFTRAHQQLSERSRTETKGDHKTIDGSSADPEADYFDIDQTEPLELQVEPTNKTSQLAEITRDYIGFDKIDSLFSLHECIKNNPKKIFLTDTDENAFKNFFLQTKCFTNLTHLAIDVNSIDTEYTNNLISFIRNGLHMLINNGLKHLNIIIEEIYNSDELIESLYFYSSLEELSINVKDKKPYSNNRYHSTVDIEQLQTLCKEITDLNKSINNFLASELPDNIRKLEQPDKSSEDYKKYLITLGEKFDEYVTYTEFHKTILDNEDFQKVHKKSRKWNIRTIVTNNQTDQLETIKTCYPNFNFNQRYSTYGLGLGFERLIDIAVDAHYFETVTWLVAQDIDTTRTYDKDQMPTYEQNKIHPVINFPLMNAFNSNQSHLMPIFLNNEAALYDALAWCICANHDDKFKMIAKERKVDFFKPIPSGAFETFTLLSLIIHYIRTEIFISIIDKLSQKEKEEVIKLTFPNKENFEYKNLPMLLFIVHQGLHNELETVIKCNSNAQALIIQHISKKSLMQSLFVGASVNCSRHSDDYEEKIKSFKRCFLLLKTHIVKVEDIQDAVIEDKSSDVNLPLLHFVIEKNIYHIIEDYIDLFTIKLTQKIWVASINANVNALQLAVMLDSEANISTIFSLYDNYKKNNLTVILEDVIQSKGINLFQYALLKKNLGFLEMVLRENNHINIPFPSSNSTYPNWLPIHIAIISDFTYTRSFVSTLLADQNIALDVPFPEGGDFSHHLVGLYPLSAIFYNGNPTKNSILTHHILLDYAGHMLEIIKISKLQNHKKIEIFTEALFYAVAHHDTNVSRQHDHSKQIKLLIEVGANAYQNLDNGFRIIDIAHEKGLLPLFSAVLNDTFKPKIPGRSKLVKNTRNSELNKFSRNSYHVTEDHYAVVSLVRNNASKLPDHVFIIVEKIVNGQSQMHFFDFVNTEPGKGKVRDDKLYGGIQEELIFRCNKEYLKIESTSDIIAQQWQITVEACDQILASISLDKGKQLDYFTPGSRSIFGSPGGKGENCYTWARKKILASDDPNIKQQMQPTLEEWLFTVPRFKLIQGNSHWYNNRFIFFAKSNIKTISIAGAAAAAAYKYYLLKFG